MQLDVSPARRGAVKGIRSYRSGCVASSTIVVAVIASVSLAPSAVADSVDALRSAVTQMRQASCGPLRSDPRVEKVAEIVNRSTDDWISHQAHAAPIDKDPLPILKDRGYEGNRAALALGAGRTVDESITMLLLQGYKTIPDCTYTDYGVSVMENPAANQGFSTLTVLVLAGP